MVTFIIVLIIVGLIAGLVARLLLPGRDPSVTPRHPLRFTPGWLAGAVERLKASAAEQQRPQPALIRAWRCA